MYMSSYLVNFIDEILYVVLFGKFLKSTMFKSKIYINYNLTHTCINTKRI